MKGPLENGPLVSTPSDIVAKNKKKLKKLGTTFEDKTSERDLGRHSRYDRVFLEEKVTLVSKCPACAAFSRIPNPHLTYAF